MVKRHIIEKGGGEVGRNSRLRLLERFFSLFRKIMGGYSNNIEKDFSNKRYEKILEKKDKIIEKQRQQIAAQTKMSMLGEMAGGVAHEINNPLAIISFSMQSIRKMIKKDMVETELFNETLSDIDQTVLRMRKIIIGLKNLSRDSSQERFDICTLDELLSDVLSVSSEKFKTHGVDLRVDLDDIDKTQNLSVLRVQFSQVLINLLSNAFDEISKRDGDKWVNLKARIEDEKLVIKVIDCGEGIPLETQEKIFEAFFTTKEVGKGTGLGLSLSKSIVERHKGEFYIDNDCPNTCFVVIIPGVIKEGMFKEAI